MHSRVNNKQFRGQVVLIVDNGEGKVVFGYQFKSILYRLPAQTDPIHKELLPLLNSAVPWNWDLTRGSPLVTKEDSLEFARHQDRPQNRRIITRRK